MNAIKNKIGSREGASISFALLAFLVCAVISSVVIVAGSTAAGRMSQIAQSDQRYYAVNSAAELLGSTLDWSVGGQVVSKAVVKTKSVTYDVNGEKTGESSEAISSAFFSEDISDIVDVEEAILNHEITPVEKGYSLLIDAAYAWSEFIDTGDQTKLPNAKKMQLTATSGEDAVDTALAVDIYETLDINGTLTFDVSKKMKKADGTEMPNAAYTLRLTFAADIKNNTASKTQHGTPSKTDGSTTDITTETTKTVIKWTLIDIVKSTVPQST